MFHEAPGTWSEALDISLVSLCLKGPLMMVEVDSGDVVLTLLPCVCLDTFVYMFICPSHIIYQTAKRILVTHRKSYITSYFKNYTEAKTVLQSLDRRDGTTIRYFSDILKVCSD